MDVGALPLYLGSSARCWWWLGLVVVPLEPLGISQAKFWIICILSLAVEFLLCTRAFHPATRVHSLLFCLAKPAPGSGDGSGSRSFHSNPGMRAWLLGTLRTRAGLKTRQPGRGCGGWRQPRTPTNLAHGADHSVQTSTAGRPFRLNEGARRLPAAPSSVFSCRHPHFPPPDSGERGQGALAE